MASPRLAAALLRSGNEARMDTLKLHKGGRLSLPQDMLDSHHWHAGTAFTVQDRPEGLLLRPPQQPPDRRRGNTPAHTAGKRATGCDRPPGEPTNKEYPPGPNGGVSQVR